MKISWKLVLLLAVLAAIGTWLTLDDRARARVESLWRRLPTSVAHAGEVHSSKTWTPDLSPKPPWDHRIVLSPDQVQGIGLKTALVEKQTLPTVLRLTGTTDYDPAKLTTVRTQFDSRVDNVLVDLGSVVQVGTPLLELFMLTSRSPRMSTKRPSASMPATRRCSIINLPSPRPTPFRARI